MSVTQGNFRPGGIPSGNFGTGGEAPDRKSLGRVFLEGMALAAGFLALRGIVTLAKKAIDSDSKEEGPISDLE